jgi:electron transfer flavoprotein alpha subunit
MSEILVFSEKAEFYPELLGKARELSKGLGGAGVSAVVAGAAAAGAPGIARDGADRVYVLKGPAFAAFDPASWAGGIAKAAGQAKASAVLVGSTRRGKEIAGRIAQKLGSPCATDVTALSIEGGALAFQRYNLGGNTVQKAVAAGACPVFALMPKTSEPAPKGSTSGAVVDVDASGEKAGLKVLEARKKEGEKVNIEDAKVLVCVGKGFSSKEEIAPAFELAKKLGGEVGCTRELATDYHWLSEERVVGLSGKKSSPGLYIGVGISGQIQHAVGITGAKCVVVVNKDKDAPFFQTCDYGVVADLKEFLPKFLKAL